MKHFFCILVFAVATIVQIANGQAITGDTIFVNAESEVSVKFMSKDIDFKTTPNNAPYTFRSKPPMVSILAKTDNTNPASLFITEGGRTHHFVLSFKKDIDPTSDEQLFFDYSTKKKLEQHVQELATRKPTAPTQPALKTEEVKTVAPAPVEQKTTSESYYAILDEGDKYFKLGMYKEATLYYENAHKLRPDDPIPTHRLEEIKLKISGNDKNSELEKNRKYTLLTAEAKALFDLKKYTESKESYKKALDLRPGDLYATNQLEKIDKILNDLQGQEEQKKLRELYSNYMDTGEKALNKNQLADARIAFEQALVIKQNDPAATNKLRIINEKEKREKEALEIENKYNDAVQSADKLFQLGDYNNAKLGYNKALAILKRPWPQDQLKNIDKIQSDLAAKELLEKQEQAKQAEIEKREKEAMEIENRYLAVVKEADNLFQAKDYAKAKAEYANALRISNKPWPKEQIAKITLLLAEESLKAKTEKQEQARQAEIEKREKETRELENNYAAAIQSADNFFKAGDYKNAKAEYLRASGFFKRPWPDEQINKINKIVEDQLAAEAAEKQRLAKEAKITAQYNTAIQNADIEFDKSNYIKARKLYSDATLLKPSEQHPQERLQIIQTTLELIAKAEKERKDSIAAETELNKKFKLAVSKGKSYILKEDFMNAKLAYEEAAGLKPADTEVQNQLTKINNKLVEIEKERQLNIAYEGKVAMADSLLLAKDFKSALALYKEAAVLKPAEIYPGKQIVYIQSEIANQDRIDAYNLKIENRRKYRELILLADKSMADKNFEAAKQQYTDALIVQPGDDYATQRLKIATYQLSLLKPVIKEEPKVIVEEPNKKKKKKSKKDDNAAKADEAKKEEVTIEKQTTGTYKFQENPIPYTPEELKIKYPNIDFTTLPADQPFNEVAFDPKKNSDIFKAMLAEKPRLDINEKVNKIKLTCQRLHFEDKRLYIKLLIQNSSDSDFLAGSMMLTWTRRAGNITRLYPVSIYPAHLPIVLPGNEAVIIYVCKSYSVDDIEKLKFELTDRMNKTKFELNFIGSVYNVEFRP